MKSKRFAFALAAAAALASVALSAQGRRTASSRSAKIDIVPQQPTFRTAVDLVTTDVIVARRQGPVRRPT